MKKLGGQLKKQNIKQKFKVHCTVYLIHKNRILALDCNFSFDLTEGYFQYEWFNSDTDNDWSPYQTRCDTSDNIITSVFLYITPI